MDTSPSNDNLTDSRTISPTRRTLLKAMAAGAAGGFASALSHAKTGAEMAAGGEQIVTQSISSAQDTGEELPIAPPPRGVQYIKIADSETPIPGGSGNFVDFVVGESSAGPSIGGGNVVFHGADSAGFDAKQRGVYASIGGRLSVVADTNTAVPDGIGNFANFSAASLRGNDIVFRGVSQGGHEGLYKVSGGTTNALVDTNRRQLGVIRELSFTLVSAIAMTIPGRSGNFTGDRVVILAENSEIQPWSQTRIEMLGANTGALQIVKMSTMPSVEKVGANSCSLDKYRRRTCMFDGFNNIPIGNAGLSVGRLPGTSDRDILRVDNIGSTLTDGVAQPVPESMEMETALLTPNFSLSQDGTTLVTTQIGIVNGKPDQLFSKLTIANRGGQLNVTGDWSPIGTTSYEIQIFNGSQLVTSQKGLSTGELTIAGTPDIQAMRCHIWIIIITSFYYSMDTQLAAPGTASASSPLLTFCTIDNSGQVREYYCDGLDNIKSLANETTLLPDRKGSFTSFELFAAVRNGVVAFVGNGSAGQSGVYKDVGGQQSVVADSNTRIPRGEGNFTSFGGVSVDDDGTVAFTGFGTNDQIGIYSNRGGRLRVIANTQTPIPDGDGNFTNFGAMFGPSYSQGRLAFTGLGESGQAGVYLARAGSLRTVVNNRMALDDKRFSDYAVYMSPNGFDGNQVAFQVLFNDFSQAIYVATIDV